MINRRRLQINNHELAAVDHSVLRKKVRWLDQQTTPQTETNICLFTVVLRNCQQIPIERLPKINNGIPQLAATLLIIAVASRYMVIELSLAPRTVVAHIILPALGTYFQVGVAVQLSNPVPRNTTLSVQSVDVLRDNELQDRIETVILRVLDSFRAPVHELVIH